MKRHFRNAFSSQALSHQMLRYLLIGGMAWLVDFTLFTLTYTTVGIFAAQTLARIAGALLGFAGHKWVVFKEKTAQTNIVYTQALQYLLLWLFSYAVSLMILFVQVHALALHPVVAKLITEAIIVSFNFTVMRRYIFTG